MRTIFTILLTALLMLSLTNCAPEKVQQVHDIEAAMKKVNIAYDSIHHMEIIDEGVVVYYLTSDGLNEGFIERGNKGWKWIFGGGSAEVHPQNGVSWHATNAIEQDIGMASGVIADEKIVGITFNGVPAKIVSNNGVTIWLAVTHPAITGIQVRGYTSDNQEITVN